MVDRVNPASTSNITTKTAINLSQPNKQLVQQFESTLASDISGDKADSVIFPGDHHYQMKNQMCQEDSSSTFDSVRAELLKKRAFPGQEPPVIDNGTAQ